MGSLCLPHLGHQYAVYREKSIVISLVAASGFSWIAHVLRNMSWPKRKSSVHPRDFVDLVHPHPTQNVSNNGDSACHLAKAVRNVSACFIASQAIDNWCVSPATICAILKKSLGVCEDSFDVSLTLSRSFNSSVFSLYWEKYALCNHLFHSGRHSSEQHSQ